MKKIKFLIICILIVSCAKQESNKKDETTIKYISKEKAIALGAYLNADNKNQIILNWSEEIDSNKTTILKYKQFDTKSNTFGKTFSVPASKGMQSHNESMAKIAKTKSGILYAIFRFKSPTPKHRFAGSIYYAISNNNGETWSKKIKLVANSASMSQSFYDIALLPDGELGLIWLDSRKIDKDKNGSSLYFSKTNNDLGFANQKAIAGSTCQCCRTDIFIDNKNTIHVAFRNITEGSIRDMYSSTSLDNGTSFSKPKRLGEDNWVVDGCPHTGPSFSNNTKNLAVTWFTGAKSGSGIFYKEINETSLKNKSLLSYTGRHPQMSASKNGDFHVVYENMYELGDNVFSAIILHTIKADGTEIKKKISEENTFNDYAVITSLKNNKLLISWRKTLKDDSSQIVSLVINNSI